MQRGGSTRYRKRPPYTTRGVASLSQGPPVCKPGRRCVIACRGLKTEAGSMRYRLPRSRNRSSVQCYRLVRSRNQSRGHALPHGPVSKPQQSPVLPHGPVSKPKQGPCVTAWSGLETGECPCVTAWSDLETEAGAMRYRLPRPMQHVGVMRRSAGVANDASHPLNTTALRETAPPSPPAGCVRRSRPA